MEINQEVVKKLADEAAEYRRKNPCEMPYAIKQILKQNKDYDNTAYFLLISKELGKRGGNVRKNKTEHQQKREKRDGINPMKITNDAWKRECLHKQKREAEDIMRQRGDHLLSDP